MTTQLPATYAEVAAVEYARDHLALFRDDRVEIAGMNLAWLDKGDNRYFAIQTMKAVALAGPEQLMTIVDYARQGWDLAHEALRELILRIRECRSTGTDLSHRLFHGHCGRTHR